MTALAGRNMNSEDISRVLAFIKKAEGLKNTLRHSFTSNGRQESAAEHSWRLCLFVMACAPWFRNLDCEKLLRLAVIHDLAEALCGDTPAICRENKEIKAARERAALSEICSTLPEELQKEMLSAWEEYESASTEEAKLVKGLDKLETLIQHNQGRNPINFDYKFNLAYGKELTDKNDTLTLFRKNIDEETKEKINNQTSGC